MFNFAEREYHAGVIMMALFAVCLILANHAGICPLELLLFYCKVCYHFGNICFLLKVPMD